MDVPLFNNRACYEPHLPELRERVNRVMESGRFILGPEVEAFESEFAKYLGVKHVVGVANGTDALTLSLLANGVGQGDEVVVPSFTFFATAEAVCHAGAKPVFCDVDPGTYCITAEEVSRVVTDRTRAVIPVHLFGNVAPMDELLALVDGRDIKMIEDAAQAAGASFNGRKAGALGDAAAFSFFPSKNLFCFGDGGAVATNSDEIADEVRLLRLRGSPDRKRTFQKVGYNSRLDEIQAAVLRVMLPELDGWNARRRRVAEHYGEEGLGDHLRLPAVTGGAEHGYNQFVSVSGGHDSKRLVEGLAKAGIEARSNYVIPVHRQPAMSEFGQGADLPVSDQLAAMNIALPMGPSLDRGTVRLVVDAVANL